MSSSRETNDSFPQISVESKFYKTVSATSSFQICIIIDVFEIRLYIMGQKLIKRNVLQLKTRKYPLCMTLSYRVTTIKY